jgi:hypothetical protein
MKGVLPTSAAILLELDTTRIVLTILARRIIPFLALCAGKGDDKTFLFLCHFESVYTNPARGGMESSMPSLGEERLSIPGSG